MFEGIRREFHNMVSDVYRLLFEWPRGVELLSSTELEYFVVEWNNLVC